MDPVQSLILLNSDLEKIREERERNEWLIEPWPLKTTTFFVTLKADIDQESYMLRLECDDYPDPPSVKCVDPTTKDPNNPKAWPRCEGFRPPPTGDLCLNITREGLKQLHPDWQKDPRYAWDSSGNPIWRVLATLQDRLNDRNKYHGRNQ